VAAQTHIFTAPFYFIEYGIAQLGALQLLERYLDDPAATVAAYRRALALGARASLRDLFAAAGLRLDLSRDHVARCMAFVRRELARLA
jgi:oligoendopeptidase F